MLFHNTQYVADIISRTLHVSCPGSVSLISVILRAATGVIVCNRPKLACDSVTMSVSL